MGVYKCRIVYADTSLGEVEPVFDLTSFPGYEESDIYSITIAEDGEIIIGVQHENTLIAISAEGARPLYPGYVLPSAERLLWGNGNYIYMVRGKWNTSSEVPALYRIRMTKTGAPVYGRD